MIIVCPSCQARYKFDEAKLGDRPRAKTRCAKCGGTIEIENPQHSLAHAATRARSLRRAAHAPGRGAGADRDLGQAQPPGGGRPGHAPSPASDLHKMGMLELPKDKRFSLAIIQGAATGQIYPITKTRTTIGRAGQDINLDDPEASRQHAVLEILGEHGDPARPGVDQRHVHRAGAHRAAGPDQPDGVPHRQPRADVHRHRRRVTAVLPPRLPPSRPCAS